MSKPGNMVPIAVLATNICMNFGDTDRKYFGEHLTNIIEIYKEFHIKGLIDGVSVQTVTLSPDNIIDLPCDYLRYTKIGIINANGRLATMNIDRNLRVPPPVTTESQLIAVLNDINCGTATGECFPFYNTYDVERNYIGEVRGYACALNNLGYFNPIRKDGIMVVSPNIPANVNILMEYISDGISEGLELVPTEMTLCITNGAKAKFCLDKRDPRAGSFQQMHELNYRDVKKLYRAKPAKIYGQLFKTLTDYDY